MTSSPDAVLAWPLPRLAHPDPFRDAASASPDGTLELPDLAVGTGRSTPESATATATESAVARGYAEGVGEGEARAAEQLRPALETLLQVPRSLQSSAAEFARDRERNLYGLALAVAQKIIQREIAADPEVVRVLVARALEMLPLDTAVEVRLHPADLELLQAEIERLAPSGRLLAIRWVGDAALERGGFLIESPARIVDGRTDVALRALYERLAYD